MTAGELKLSGLAMNETKNGRRTLSNDIDKIPKSSDSNSKTGQKRLNYQEYDMGDDSDGSPQSPNGYEAGYKTSALEIRNSILEAH